MMNTLRAEFEVYGPTAAELAGEAERTLTGIEPEGSWTYDLEATPQVALLDGQVLSWTAKVTARWHAPIAEDAGAPLQTEPGAKVRQQWRRREDR